MYVCKHFRIHELVPKTIYDQWGSRAWEFLDSRLLLTLDSLRDYFGPITVNDYMYGGKREWSGLRTIESPYFSATSQHSFGRAADMLIKGWQAEAAREEILRHRDKKFPYINGMELNVSWVHIDIRNHQPIKLFKP